MSAKQRRQKVPSLYAGLAKSGLLGIWSQLLCLAFAILPAILSSYTALPDALVTHFLVGGLVLSRLGLWLFDLCVNQLLQEEVSPNQLGKRLVLPGLTHILYMALQRYMRQSEHGIDLKIFCTFLTTCNLQRNIFLVECLRAGKLDLHLNGTVMQIAKHHARVIARSFIEFRVSSLTDVKYFAGVVSGWQGSLASLFQSTSFLVGIFLPDPADYNWLMAGSWFFVLSAAIIYSLWIVLLRPARKPRIGSAMENAVEIQPIFHDEEGR